MAKVFEKQPSEIIDYFVNMIDYFEELEGDYVENTGDVTVNIEPSGSLIAGATVLVNGGKDGFKQWFSGGTDKTKYKVTFLVTTYVGRVEEFEMYIKVKDT